MYKINNLINLINLKNIKGIYFYLTLFNVKKKFEIKYIKNYFFDIH
jgi:hypothetical protein